MRRSMHGWCTQHFFCLDTDGHQGAVTRLVSTRSVSVRSVIHGVHVQDAEKMKKKRKKKKTKKKKKKGERDMSASGWGF